MAAAAWQRQLGGGVAAAAAWRLQVGGGRLAVAWRLRQLGGGGASATAVDIAAGDAVAADDDNAVDAVIPLSSTNDEDMYVGASLAF